MAVHVPEDLEQPVAPGGRVDDRVARLVRRPEQARRDAGRGADARARARELRGDRARRQRRQHRVRPRVVAECPDVSVRPREGGEAAEVAADQEERGGCVRLAQDAQGEPGVDPRAVVERERRVGAVAAAVDGLPGSDQAVDRGGGRRRAGDTWRARRPLADRGPGAVRAAARRVRARRAAAAREQRCHDECPCQCPCRNAQGRGTL